ncbi:class I SAM-dependent methyltransferase [Pimelobacter simplex]|uniref:class I SAM-dependent methyltransferase n=1 Tax=Nocardioides simplex TaxID=2045 RepID=UPI00214F9DCB|nr:class I SAM-dependent methyltransferase [Pimelobacter simplex]UUW90320.1 class I SAM-dependent methyltransferase [Pimelobacter simplex]UUW94150.1 class I SAM-dependent methyltransferase [Pimelobacter simplex]
MGFDFSASYDELNPADDDHRFYERLALAHGARDAVDLGCGTGSLARRWAGHGLRVHAVDPDPAMIRVAAGRGDVAGRVAWTVGYSDVLATGSADLVVMTGHVAQVFVEDVAWSAVLADAGRALRLGGLLAFEFRHPQARAWEGWTRAATLRIVETGDGPVEFWHETVEVDLPRVAYDTFTRNLATGEVVAHRDVLAFRSPDAIAASLAAAGFAVDRLRGSWDGAPVTPRSVELIVCATRLLR